MNLNEICAQCVRLRDEIDSLGRAGRPSEARLARLRHALDQVELELAAFRRRARAAPILREVVARGEPNRARPAARVRMAPTGPLRAAGLARP